MKKYLTAMLVLLAIPVLMTTAHADAIAGPIVLEAAAVIVEWICYRAYSEQVKKPFLFALLINLFSYGVGCVINLL